MNALESKLMQIRYILQALKKKKKANTNTVSDN